MRSSNLLSACITATLAISGVASAHHSFNMYDYTVDQPLAGTIKLFTWSNPHGLIMVEVPQPGGAPVLWHVELSSPNILGRRGWNSHSLSVGEDIKLVIHPMRDGRKASLLVSVTTPAGKTLVDSAGALKKDE